MLSYSRGPVAPLIETPIHQTLADTAARHPDGLALVSRHQGVRLTWSGLAEEVERTARGLAGLGLEKGERFGIWAANCAEWIYLQLAAARLGLVLVNVNPAYRSHELEFVLRRSGIRALFLHEKDHRADYRRILAESRNGTPLPLEHVVYLNHPSWDAMLAGGVPFTAPEISCHDTANIQYTSGTTGEPKGVLLSHANILNNAVLIGQRMRITHEDRICAPVPLYHCFGCVMASLLCVGTGAALILPSAQFDALAALEAVHAERSTAIYGVPAMFIAELERPEFTRFDLTSLRTGIMAGAPCPIEVMRRVITRMHCREMTIAYGQTESSPVITQSHAADDIELRASTVGCPLPNTEVKIVSRETGETLPVGETGELCTRGYLVMQGYDGQPEATREAAGAGGWLRTGDLAVMYPDGYFGIRGRAREMIIRGGENIYPREIEDFLLGHPVVSEVYVFGLPDARLGETVCAWARLKPGASATEEDLRDYCRGRIAYFKIPQYIRFTTGFPMTVSGKPRKFLMREREIAERGLEAAATAATA